MVDTGLDDQHDEVGFHRVRPLVVGWLGICIPVTASPLYLSATGKKVDVDKLGWGNGAPIGKDAA